MLIQQNAECHCLIAMVGGLQEAAVPSEHAHALPAAMYSVEGSAVQYV